MAALHKVVSYAPMDPVLWESLPRELLVLVLARLPVPEITRLHCRLFKEWTMNMEFNRVCDEAKPNMAALLSFCISTKEFSVGIFDFSKHIWLHGYRFRLTHRGIAPGDWRPMACHGGLICFVSTCKYTKANPLCIVMINLLTRVQHELPPLHHVYIVPPTLVHMKVDSETKTYKVVVVGKQPKDHHTTETYDSFSRQWSRSTPSWGRIWDYAHEYRSHCNYFGLKSVSLCTYDLEQGQLELQDCNVLFQSERACVKKYALAGDRMFVLHQKLNRHNIGTGLYFITEYQSQNNGKVWAPVKTYSQRLFVEEHDCLFDLQACEDVLVLRHRRSYQFFNFSTSEWGNLPSNWLDDKCPRCQIWWPNHILRNICHIFWNVIP